MTFFCLSHSIAKRHRLPEETGQIIGLMTAGWIFLWVQRQNFVWEFQSHFFLVYLLPINALVSLSKSESNKCDLMFWVSALLGVLSAGTMANGVSALPILFFYSVFIRNSHRKSLILLVLSLLVMSIYFYDYHPPTYHSSIHESIITTPVDFFTFLTLYLGSVFGYIFDNMIVAIVFGAVFLATAAGLFFWSLKAEPTTTIATRQRLCLLFFVIYVGMSALATAGARLNFGVNFALISRYATPTTMAWAALFILAFDYFHSKKYRASTLHLVASCVILLASFSVIYQFRDAKRGYMDGRSMGALALALGIRDREIITTYIYPDQDIDLPLRLSRVAREKNLLGFSDYPLVSISSEIDSFFKAETSADCIGHVDSVERIEDDDRFYRIQGWMFDGKQRKSPRLIRFVDANSVIRGYAITGGDRDDLGKIIDRNADKAGFLGYIESRSPDGLITAYGDRPSCDLVIGYLQRSSQ